MDINKVYFKFILNGYCNRSLENKTIKKALSNFKIFIQQGLFKGLLIIVEKKPAGLGLLGWLTHYQVPKISLVSVDSTDVIDRVVTTDVPLDISKLLDSIDFDWTKLNVKKTIGNDSFEVPIKGYLRLPSLLIESEGSDVNKIKSSIEWCFDAIANENQTMSFLQVCIGLEALLGDSESKNGSLTEILADRCAYLVSNDIKGRKTIKNKFKELYKVRSKLVHGVNVSLASDQKRHYDWGKLVLEYAIIKEIKHLNLK